MRPRLNHVSVAAIGDCSPASRQGRRARLRAGFLIVLLFLPALAVPADPLIKSAHGAETAGDTALASALSLDWLRANPGAPGSAKVFASWFSAERDFPTLLGESRTFLTAGKGCVGAGEQFLRIARLFDLAGLTEESRDAYLGAWAEGAVESSLVSAAVLSIEMNDTGTLSKLLAGAAGRQGESLIAALAALGSGDYETAAALLSALAAATADPDLALRSRWILFRIALARGDRSGSDLIRIQLASLYPGSPEAALAAVPSPVGDGMVDRPVRLSPSAFEVFSLLPVPPDPGPAGTAQSPAPSPAQEPVPATAGAQGKYLVQAGSFQVRENADYLASDLVKKGFSPTVVQDSVRGKDRFRVLAGAGLARDRAQDLLAQLVGAGYSGFLASEP